MFVRVTAPAASRGFAASKDTQGHSPVLVIFLPLAHDSAIRGQPPA